MALIVSAASGNFNAGATWVGGVVPGVGDEAQAATGHTITITANATCTEISNAGTGIFTLNGGVTLNANVTNKSTTVNRSVLQFTAASPATGSIVGNVSGQNTSNSLPVGAVVNTSSGTLNVTGNVTAVSQQANGVTNTSTGTLNVTGNVISGAGANSWGASNTSTGVLTITGNVTGGTGSTCHGASNGGTGTLIITGNCTGGTNTGNGAFQSSTGTLSVIGTLQSSQTAAAVAGTSVQQNTILSGPFLTETTRGVAPVYCAAWRWNASPSNSTYMEVMTNNLLAKRSLYTADNITGMPAASNVKSGITYGPSSELTGTFSQTVTPSTADIATAVWGHASRTITGGTVTTLTNAPASVTPSDIWSHASRTLTTSSGPTAAEIRQEIDANSTKLANLDATVSSRLATSGYTAPTSAPSVADIRTELAVELGRLDASVSSRLASASYTAPTTPPTAAQIATAVEGSLLNEADGQAVLNAIVGAIGNTNLSEVSLVAAVRADLERSGGKLDSIPTTAAPSASSVAGAVRTELATELGRLDASVSSRLAPSGTLATVTNLTNAPASVTPSDIWSHATRTLTSASGPTAVEIRQEIDANSTKLDAAISTRMAASEASKLDGVKAKTDLLNTDRLANVATTNIVGTLLAQSQS